MRAAAMIRGRAGFTLVETLIAAAVSSMVLAGVAASSIAMRRTYEAANYHVNAQAEQLRVFDYIGRDVKAASKAVVVDGGRRLDLAIPDGTGSLAGSLDLPVCGTFRAGAGSAVSAVSYYVEGDRLIRAENGRAKEVARSVTNFVPTMSGGTGAVEITATFSPRYSRSPLTAAQSAMRLRSTFLVRKAAPLTHDAEDI